jgi:AAA family ATP:ADP antiporter
MGARAAKRGSSTASQSRERSFALLMFVYFFLVITCFWILKPLKKIAFVAFYDRSGFDLGGWHLEAAQAELVAKVLNTTVAFVAVLAFSLLARRFRRERLAFLCTGFFLAGFVGYALSLAEPSAAEVWSFYLFGDLFSTLMVATFFAFLSDSVTPDAAKRLYGPIGLGGLLGGVVGSTVVAARIEDVEMPHWLWLCLGIGVLILVVAIVAGRLAPSPGGAPDPRGDDGEGPLAASLEGARLLLRSRYLVAIATIVGVYEIVSTLLDFQFTSAVAHHLDGDAIEGHLASVFAVTNGVSLAVQVLFTRLVMTRLGVGAALLALPAACFGGSCAFLAAPSLWTGSLLNVVDNGFSYSIHQSAKEALYVPTSAREKYQAKAFIDMFVQRFAKAVAVVLGLGVTERFERFETLRWLSLPVIALIVLWVWAVRQAGGRFRKLEGERSGRGARYGALSDGRPRVPRVLAGSRKRE